MTKIQKRLGIWASVLWITLYGIKSFGGAGIENVYSRVVYRYIANLKGAIFGILPFSMGDLFYILMFSVLVVCLIRILQSIWQRKWLALRKYFLYFYVLLIGVWVYFDLSWGLNYYRLPVMTYLEIPRSEINVHDYKKLVSKYIAITNSLKAETSSTEWQIPKADKEISSYIQQDNRWNDYLTKRTLKVKQPFSSEIISYMLVGGYYNPFSHEAQVNSNLPLTSYPYTVAHELAHKMGIGFEDECNFLAFLYLKDANNSWYRYSAYLNITKYLLGDLAGIDAAAFGELKNELSEAVMIDIRKEQEHWEKYTNLSSQISNVLYSLYLIGNNQPEGLNRYSQVSQLVYDWEMNLSFE